MQPSLSRNQKGHYLGHSYRRHYLSRPTGLCVLWPLTFPAACDGCAVTTSWGHVWELKGLEESDGTFIVEVKGTLSVSVSFLC